MERTILIKAKAGLGNRILATLTGIAFGLLCKRRILVDWGDGAYAAPAVNSFPRLFDSAVVSSDDVVTSSLSVAPTIWRGQTDKPVVDLIARFDPRRFSDPTIYRKYCCDLSTLEHPEELIVFWSYLPKFQRIRRHFHGEFFDLKHLPERELVRELMSRFMPLRQDILDEVEAFQRDKFKTPMIGVHVRYSDIKTPLDKTHRAIERFISEQPESAIFLATDNRAVEDTFKKRYSRVVVTPKWLPQPGEKVHYNTGNTSLEASAIEALKDIYLLARTDFLVYPGRSTFSYLSRCLGRLPDRKICDVQEFDPTVRLAKLVHGFV